MRWPFSRRHRVEIQNPSGVGPEALRDQGLCAEWYVLYRLQEEVERAKRYDRALSVLLARPRLFDGERLSFSAKQAAADAAQLACRAVDIVGWLGSDHILIVLPETTSEQAEFAAKRLADQVWLRSRHIGGQRWQITRVDDPRGFETVGEFIRDLMERYVLPQDAAFSGGDR
jgi:hypothetical protein